MPKHVSEMFLSVAVFLAQPDSFNARMDIASWMVRVAHRFQAAPLGYCVLMDHVALPVLVALMSPLATHPCLIAVQMDLVGHNLRTAQQA